ncbi:Ldh family oxidoreductase [Liquorilactobacillus uvarum]|uniref:Malate dehydrogenase n=1 Tax=Liquorilactobacillus uvarum DSM 19971 TaxID=1423812 RepID=A0A0R1Q3S5_9LACO|nr:Ldh family oxidoreductase [Liquorilactobacillus uvarum]KRL36818.1 malate dehydrogenase [Liquorilactobacillus uvarum DSM 19971]
MRIKGEYESELLTKIFVGWGFSNKKASLITEVLSYADLRGIYSHGIQRLKMYEKKIKAGYINQEATIQIVRQTPNCIVVDAHHAMGQLASIEVMERIIRMAKKNGIAFATVRNSNHFGAAGYYAEMASRSKLIGFAATSTNPLLVPPGGKAPFLGSNPFAVSFPMKKNDFVFDGATSAVSLGKIEVLEKLKKQIPGEWAVAEDGKLEKKPKNVLDNLTKENRAGGVLPIGGLEESNSNYKGFAISLIVEIMTSIFAQGSIAADLGNKKHDISHFFMVIDPTLFISLKQFKNHLSDMLGRIKKSETVDGKPVTLPGEKEQIALQQNSKYGIDLDVETLKEVRKICAALEIDF